MYCNINFRINFFLPAETFWQKNQNSCLVIKEFELLANQSGGGFMALLWVDCDLGPQFSSGTLKVM